MRVAGIDPGSTTGIAVFSAGTLVAAEEVGGVAELRAALLRHRPARIVCEDFLGSRGFANSRDPLLVIGAVQMYCEERGVPLTMQNPGILTTWRRRAEDLHPSRHVRSAAAHVLHYLDGLL